MSILSDSVKNFEGDRLDRNYFGLLLISEIYSIHEKFRDCRLFPSSDTACHNTIIIFLYGLPQFGTFHH
jgi:hypothetical protein